MPSPPPPGIPLAVWNVPAVPAPKGEKSLFEDGENRDTELIIINGVFLALMIVAVLMRFVVRRKGQERLSWDSAALIVAALGSIAHSVLIIDSLDIGYGRHIWDIRAVKLTHNAQLQMNQIFMCFTISAGFAKLSVLLLYRRFFKIVPFTNVLIWFGIVFNALFTISYIGVGTAQAVKCTGMASLTDKFCLNWSKASVIAAAINVVLEFFILFIPLQQVYHLKVDRQRKIGVAAVFGVGFLACLASVVRLGWFANNLHQSDTLWSAVLSSELSSAEINIVIIAPCLIFMPAFIKYSKTGLSSIRSRLISRGSKTSVNNTPSQDTITVGTPQRGHSHEIRKQQSVELVFLREPSTEEAPTAPGKTYDIKRFNGSNV